MSIKQYPEIKSQKQLQESLDYLFNVLIEKGFKFVTPQISSQEMHEQLGDYDQKILKLSNQVFGFLVSGSDLNQFAKIISKNVIGFGMEDVDDEALMKLQQLMQARFPLCAFTFSKMYGPRFLALINGDNITKQELFSAMENFETINLSMMELSDRISLKVFGKSILKINSGYSTGSMIIYTSQTSQANTISGWVAQKPLQNDTIVNQLKERFTRWQFWAKALIGMIEYKPYQLRQEVIVLDAQTGQPISTASPRLGFEFGFSLEEITKA